MDAKHLLGLGLDGHVRQMAAQIFPGAELDVVSSGMDKPGRKSKNRQYDQVLAYFALNQFSIQEAGDVLKEWSKRLNGEGSLHLFVPALEWVAEQQVFHEHPLVLAQARALYGEKGEYKHCYSLRHLRQVLAAAGYHVQRANSGKHVMGLTETGEEVFFAIHYVMAQFVGLPDPDEVAAEELAKVEANA